MSALRKYQTKDLAVLRSSVKSGERKILFEASVGYGKSVIIETIAHGYASRGDHVLILSNRTAVVDQLNKRARGNTLIRVTTVQTADSRLDTLTPPRVILVDEAHMGGAAAQYGRVFDAFDDALVVGFTGTPTPALHKTLTAHVIGHNAAWLTDHGFLAPLRYVCPDRLDLRKARTRNGDFVDEDILAEVESKDICGDAIHSYKDGCVGRPTLLFAINKKHAWAVHDEFRAAGIESRVLLGGDADVEEKLSWIGSGGLLISVGKVNAGFDLPDLHAIISLRPTKSEQLWVQQMGRVARAADGKLAGWVYDHVGNTMRCGTLTEDRDFSTSEGLADDAVTEEGQRLSIRRCDDCFFVWHGAGCICPECGIDNGQDLRLSKKEAVQLREQSAAEIEEKRRQAGLSVRKAQGQAKTLKTLTEEIARRPGTKNRHSAKHSARHVLEARMLKDHAAGRIDDAMAIHADLTASGFRIDFPGDEGGAVQNDWFEDLAASL